MNPLTQSLIRPLQRLHRDRRATALTEFAITLPVFMLFLSGIVTLYDLQQQALFTHQESVSELWERAVHIQETGPLDSAMSMAQGNPMSTLEDMGHMSSASGAYSVNSFYNEMGFGDDWLGTTTDNLSTLGGMHGDSGLKTEVFHQAGLTPNHWSDNSWPHQNVSDVGDSSALDTLMQDRIDQGGFRPALAAGLRYGIAGGTADREFSVNDSLREYSAESLTGYNASAPTYPSERLAAVFFAWRHVSGTDGYDNMIEFGITRVGSGADSAGDVDDIATGNEECEAETQAWSDCVQNQQDQGTSQDEIEDVCGDVPDCAEESSDGLDDIGNCEGSSNFGGIDPDGSGEPGC